MDNRVNILYIHGMGGGSDSRIPKLLHSLLKSGGYPADVICRTYDFNPETASRQIDALVRETEPALIIGESRGANHALCLEGGVPTILVSPALGAPFWLGRLSPLALVPGIPALMQRIYRPREGDRQPLRFNYATISKYNALYADVKKARHADGQVFAFFGTEDRYRRSGTVNVRKWKKSFGEGSFVLYEGSHFMEDGLIRSLLLPKIIEVLGIQART